MSTRCLTRVFDDTGAEILCLYRHCDGYPEGHGKELAKFLKSRVLVNGLNGEPTPKGKTKANGMGNLAVQLVTYMVALHGANGSLYIHAPGTNSIGEYYVYEVRRESLKCVCTIGKAKVLYDGPASDFKVVSEEDE